MIMSATLLIVSGVPMAAAKECAMPMPQMQKMHAADGGMAAMHEDMHGMKGMHDQMRDEAMPMQHKHDPAAASDQHEEQIMAECCCSFHGLIDSLPHLLAPHMTSDTAALAKADAKGTSLYVETAWLVRKTRIPLPPPEFV